MICIILLCILEFTDYIMISGWRKAAHWTRNSCGPTPPEGHAGAGCGPRGDCTSGYCTRLSSLVNQTEQVHCQRLRSSLAKAGPGNLS